MDVDSAKALIKDKFDVEARFAQRRLPKTAPYAMLGERVLVRQRPAYKSASIVMPDTAMPLEQKFEGEIIAAGPEAAEKLHDAGVDRDDWIIFAKYAGIHEEWSHWIDKGSDPTCSHPRGLMQLIQDTPAGIEARRCEICGAVKVTEALLAMLLKDPVADVDLQVRLEDGKAAMVRWVELQDGSWHRAAEVHPGESVKRTMFRVERLDKRPCDPTSWDINNVLQDPEKVSE